MAALESVFLATLPVLLVCAIPAVYLSVCWKFTLPLIIDRQIDFWTAMGTSRRMVGRHWWLIFGLVVLISLLNIVGLLPVLRRRPVHSPHRHRGTDVCV